MECFIYIIKIGEIVELSYPWIDHHFYSIFNKWIEKRIVSGKKSISIHLPFGLSTAEKFVDGLWLMVEICSIKNIKIKIIVTDNNCSALRPGEWFIEDLDWGCLRESDVPYNIVKLKFHTIFFKCMDSQTVTEEFSAFDIIFYNDGYGYWDEELFLKELDKGGLFFLGGLPLVEHEPICHERFIQWGMDLIDKIEYRWYGNRTRLRNANGNLVPNNHHTSRDAQRMVARIFERRI